MARLGRDEFVILSVENDEAGVVEVLLSRLIQALTQEKIAAAIGGGVILLKDCLKQLLKQIEKCLSINVNSSLKHKIGLE
ncbi:MULTISPECIES: hypothetical protein [unclassified Acinetobacter]|uniref:hypothetical protein n=1 Tax=unclassified Acinetobacter TaxID=196816 RepID=UPI002076257E|nr:hypothetical protein [Acinetobacter sp. ANC 4218]